MQAVAFYEYQDVPGSDEEMPDLDGAVSEDGSQAGSASGATSAATSPPPATYTKRRRCTASSAVSDAGTGPAVIPDDASSRLQPQAAVAEEYPAPTHQADAGLLGAAGIADRSCQQQPEPAPLHLQSQAADLQHPVPSDGAAGAAPGLAQPPAQQPQSADVEPMLLAGVSTTGRSAPRQQPQQAPDPSSHATDADMPDVSLLGCPPGEPSLSNQPHSNGSLPQQPVGKPLPDAEAELRESILQVPADGAVPGAGVRTAVNGSQADSGMQQHKLQRWPPGDALQTYPEVGHADPPLAPRHHVNGVANGNAGQAVQASMGSLDAESQPDLSPNGRADWGTPTESYAALHLESDSQPRTQQKCPGISSEQDTPAYPLLTQEYGSEALHSRDSMMGTADTLLSGSEQHLQNAVGCTWGPQPSAMPNAT